LCSAQTSDFIRGVSRARPGRQKEDPKGILESWQGKGSTPFAK
jgi:hypothetical protein